MRILGITGQIKPPSYESIATANGTGTSQNITFSSIPSTYKHLQLRAIMRSTEISAGTGIYLQFNSDTGSNYSHHRLTGDGTSAASVGQSTQTRIFLGSTPAASTASNIMGVLIIDILDYASTSKYKTSRYLFGRDSNNQYAGSVMLASGLWQSTSAISSINLTCDNPNFATSTNFALYGIRG